MDKALWVNGWWPSTLEEAIAKAEKMGKKVYATDGKTPTDKVVYTPTTLDQGAETAYGWS